MIIGSLSGNAAVAISSVFTWYTFGWIALFNAQLTECLILQVRRKIVESALNHISAVLVDYIPNQLISMATSRPRELETVGSYKVFMIAGLKKDIPQEKVTDSRKYSNCKTIRVKRMLSLVTAFLQHNKKNTVGQATSIFQMNQWMSDKKKKEQHLSISKIVATVETRSNQPHEYFWFHNLDFWRVRSTVRPAASRTVASVDEFAKYVDSDVEWSEE